MNKRENSIRVKRLEALKQATILRYFDSIQSSYNSGENYSMEVCDTMLEHFLQGDLDEYFLSKSLADVDTEKQKEIFDLARKYSSLCFYQGNYEYWLDSIEGVSLSDSDFICMKVLDNYDFLLELARDGGEDVLRQLVTFQSSHMANESAVIDYLRNTFGNDKVLKDVLVEMSKTDGEYKHFNDEQKAVLCTYPEGVLYRTNDDGVEMIPSNELERKLSDEIFSESIDSFDEAVLRIYYESQDNRYYR